MRSSFIAYRHFASCSNRVLREWPLAIALGLLISSVSLGQSDDDFKIPSPQPKGSFQQAEKPEDVSREKLPPLSFNDLRTPNDLRNPATQQENAPKFQPMVMPRREESTGNQSSILQRAPQIPDINPNRAERNIPVLNPREFNVPPIHEDLDAEPIRSSRASSNDPSASIRMSDSGFVRQASANMQEDANQFGGNTGGFSHQPNSRTPNIGGLQPKSGNTGGFQGGGGSLSPRQFDPPPTTPNNTGGNFGGGLQDRNSGNFGGNSLTPQNRSSMQPSDPSSRLAAGGGNGLSLSVPSNPPPATRIETSIAKSLMGQYDINRTNQALPGEPVSLRHLLQQTSPQKRSGMVAQYWLTYQAWCEMVCCQQYVSALSQIQDPRNPAEKNLLNTARSMSQDELLNAEIHLARAQSRLQQYMPNSQDQLVLPLPSDQPLITNYKTHYDYYASRRTIPSEIRNIATSMPDMLMLVSQRASTAQRSQTSMNQIRQFGQGGQAPIVEVLAATRMWSDANKQLVRSVVNYNRSIAAYSMSVLGYDKPVEQLAVALVGKPKSPTPVGSPNSRQATLPQEYQQPAPSFTPRSGMGAQPMGNPAFNNPRPGQNSGLSQPRNDSGLQIPPQNQFDSRGSFSAQPGSFGN